MNKKNNNIRFVLAIVFALWFAFAGIFWVYWLALYIAYPFGIASFFIWKNIKKDQRKHNKAIPIILLVGLACSLGMWVAMALDIRF